MIALGIAHACTGVSGDEKRILIYTRNGEGYVHDNIAASVAAMEKICAAEGYETDVSEDPSLFTPENLQRYAAIVFSIPIMRPSKLMSSGKPSRPISAGVVDLWPSIRPMPPKGSGPGTGPW